MRTEHQELLTGDARFDRFTTWGHRHGSCGHWHRTRESAKACLAEHRRAVAGSDREVVTTLELLIVLERPIPAELVN